MHDEHAQNQNAPEAHEPREEQSNLMMDDINIPMVATSVAFFVVLLAVTIIGLQAAFYEYEAAERRSKTLPQEDARTVLGALLQNQREQSHVPFNARRPTEAQATATGSAPASQGNPKWVSIDDAMQLVSREYSQAKA